MKITKRQVILIGIVLLVLFWGLFYLPVILVILGGLALLLAVVPRIDMGVRVGTCFLFKVNVLPSLLAGEKVLFFKPWVWAASGKSLPTYRVWCSLPPVLEHGLYVTDRRVLHVFHFCRLITQECSQWFEGKQEPGYDESVKDVSVGTGPLLGPYLDVVSESLVKRWYRSRRLRLRLYMRNPESVCRIISEAMTGGCSTS